MGKKKLFKLCTALCLALSMLLLPPAVFHAQAAEAFATVEGTVQSGTTASLLMLSTKEGNMEIKIDRDTDLSACKILLPDQKVSVSVSYGDDAYLHAVKISNGTQSAGITVDTAAATTVTGTIGEKTKGDMLYLSTAQGEMQIKLDETTNMSACSVLAIGKTYTISCARGSDAYMHAISISDSLTTIPAASSSLSGSTSSYLSVTGTPTDSTTENLLYLSTNEGVMQFVIDDNTSLTNGRVLTSGNTLTVSFYHGTDGWLHAVSITGSKESLQGTTVYTESTTDVVGVVKAKSTENLLYLDTDYGVMMLKLSALDSMNNCRALVKGQKVTVTCAYASDAYLYAVGITAAK